MRGAGVALFVISAILNIMMASEFGAMLRRIRELEEINARIMKGRKKYAEEEGTEGEAGNKQEKRVESLEGDEF